MKYFAIIALIYCQASLVVVADDGYAKWAAKQVQEALNQKKPITWNDNLVVPTADVAVTIHRAVAGAIFGKSKIEKQRPFQAIHSGEYWVVFGTLPRGIMGGTAVTVIRASDGAVLRVIHEQ